jgi:DNA-binding transcriptional LysR family regulator
MTNASKPLNPLNVDFAALRTLRLVHDHLSFSAAADVLQVNQSAVSYTIDRLRKVFGDPLFVRQGARIAATDRCTDIVERAMALIDDFEALIAPIEFIPEDTDHTFRIACNYYERRIVLPPVVQQFRARAPKAKLEVLSSTAHGKLQLIRSDTEMLIGPIRPDETGFYCRNLLSDRYVVIMDPGHPLAKSPISLEAYAAAPHIVVTYGGSFRSRYLEEAADVGLKINDVMQVPSPASLEDYVVGSGLISTVPERIARSFGKAIKVVESPLPAPFDIDLVWTTRTHHSPKHRWLRDLIAAQMEKIP